MNMLDLSQANIAFALTAVGNSAHGPGDLLNNIALCVITAAILAFIANKLRQPAILAYLLAGVLIGPEIGFRLVTDAAVIEVISEIGAIDFNPNVYSELRRRGIASIYGDVAHMETLHHAKIHDSKLVVSTIPDQILKGTDNARLLKKIRQLCPRALAIVTADSPQSALELYKLGADFVFIPRIHSSAQVAQIIKMGLSHGLAHERDEQIAQLTVRNEVLA